MKMLFTITFSIFFFSISVAQPTVRRNIRFRTLGNDSINLSFNPEYNLIEDSCASITRYGHARLKERIFFGKIKDISNDNPGLVIAEGSYSTTGLKEGPFTTHYLNGNLQAQVNFKENKYAGKGSFFYPDGKPKMNFEAAGNEIIISDFWNETGKKIIDAGNGNYTADLGTISWSGKLKNGKPDGTWKATRTNDRTNSIIVKENFKDGIFEKGNGIGGDYNDASRIILISDKDLPLINAEKLRISTLPCDGVPRKKIVYAQYREGAQAFSEKIKELVSPYLSTVNLKGYDSDLELTGEISTKGAITKLKYTNAFDDRIASGLSRELLKLPNLEPALLDGKPVDQKIIFTFKFMNGVYRYGYRMVPLEVN